MVAETGEGANAEHRRLLTRRSALIGGVVGIVAIAVVLNVVGSDDGLSLVDGSAPTHSYLGVFLLVFLDAIVPIFPGETTLNAAATAAAQSTLALWPVIVAGALGAILGESALFWIARRSSRRVAPQLDKARAKPRIEQALALMDSSAPLLIVGGRYVPGMRFVVNATMGLSDIPTGASCPGRPSAGCSGARTPACSRTRWPRIWPGSPWRPS